VEIYKLHEWQVNYTRAREIQKQLSKEVISENAGIAPQLIAGVDISSHGSHGRARGAVVVVSYPSLKLVEVETVETEVTFPYIPGLLSFRECPVILEACDKLRHIPDLIIVDGQGIAHPRRLGLASHLGLFLDTPTIGCAKSILCGQHGPVEEKAGSFAELVYQNEVVGAALRTRSGVKPVYISIGHKIDLPSALTWTIRCCHKYRLPEPTRLAHLAAGGNLAFQPRY
jgi:deoxyribonuclease V